MKKIISTIIAGAVILSLSACSGSSGQSTASVSETTIATTTEATTTTTAETTTEETTTTETSESKPSFDEMIPSEGEIAIDYTDMDSSEIAPNIMKIIRIRTDTTAESFAKRFSTPPAYSYSKGVWTFTWGKKALKNNTVGKLKIKANKDGDKMVFDKDSNISFTVYIEDYEAGTRAYDKIRNQLRDDGDAEFLKEGLAINPDRCWHRISILHRYKKYDFVGVEIDIRVSIRLPEEEQN